MDSRDFLTGLVLTTALIVLMGMGFVWWVDIWHHAVLFYAAIALLLPLTVLIYWLANRLIHSQDKYAIVRLVMGNMMSKLFLAVVVIIAYTRTRDIDTTLFIVPFFVAYLGYTAFETYYLHQISKIDS